MSLVDRTPNPPVQMEAFLVSTFAVAIGEIGDKTQLLALLLAVRFRRPWPIIGGIFVATIFNHALAAFVGQWVAHQIPPDVLRWLLGGSFLAIAIWALKPDDMADEDLEKPGYGVFVLTCITFFLAEIGDKTQLATMALAARFQNLVPVLLGTTLGMMLADTPAVFLGRIASPKFPFRLMRMAAAAIFAALGIAVLAGFSFGL
jgi:putative Ca2+/H+ antiporter (TMEM165/GDT1 family)